MDGHLAWEAVLSFLALIGGGFLKMQQDRIKALEESISEIPNVYARRDDMKEAFDRLYALSQRIEDKLDSRLQAAAMQRADRP